jgi:hypothetical protein
MATRIPLRDNGDGPPTAPLQRANILPTLADEGLSFIPKFKNGLLVLTNVLWKSIYSRMWRVDVEVKKACKLREMPEMIH